MQKNTKGYLLMVIAVTCGVSTFFTQGDASASVKWHRYYDTIFGYYRRQKVVKYSPTGWGLFEAGLKSEEFKTNKYTQYTYNKKNRTMLVRYKNTNIMLPVKYNYIKIKLSDGHKVPIFTYHYKVGKDKWTYLNSVKYWLVKPTKF